MSQMGRAAKNLEAPRPLKSTLKQSHVHLPVYEVQSIDELISLTEDVAATLAKGCNNADGMNALLANLRLYGPQLENVSQDTLDRAFVIFRNASQDERLNIMTRLNLLELIELRAKSWQVSDGTNTYYKHKATNVEPDVLADPNLLGSSPPLSQMVPALAPGELIRTSGKFPKPTKIPGKTYCKDEIVIRNADSGKVMGIKGRRVHMIEELSETVISFQRVATGAKERLVQITGPNEEKINYAKQLIEDTIRRNASPVRLDSQDGSCSSLASSASDETVPRKEPGSSSSNARSSLVGALVELAGNATNGMAYGMGNQQSMQPATTGALTLNLGVYSHAPSAYSHPKLSRNGSQNNGQRNGNAASGAGMLLHSFSTNDASLGEYKYTVNVGQHNLKITGDCLELVKVAKLVLDDYFSSNEFLASVDMCTSFDLPNSLASPVTTMAGGPHSLITGTPFVDSGVGLNTMSANVGELGGNGVDLDDDVFVVEPAVPLKTGDIQNTGSAANNGLSRSRRSHFSRKDSAGEGLVTGSAPSKPSDSNPVKRIDYERLIYYAKSPFSWELPADWQRICDVLPNLVKNKVRPPGTSALQDVTPRDGEGFANIPVAGYTKLTKTKSLEWACPGHVTNKCPIIHSIDEEDMGAANGLCSNNNRRNVYLSKSLMQRYSTISCSSFDITSGTPPTHSRSTSSSNLPVHSKITNNTNAFRQKRYSSTANLASCASNVAFKGGIASGRILMRYKSTSD